MRDETIEYKNSKNIDPIKTIKSNIYTAPGHTGAALAGDTNGETVAKICIGVQ